VGRIVKIGVMADIHSNLPALEAVLNKFNSCDHIVCAGDIVGYYDQPNEVCECIRSLNAITIRGNHDGYVIGFLEPKPENRDIYRTDWTRDTLTSENLEWLQSLPSEHEIIHTDVKILIRHANPWDEERYIYPDSTELMDKINLSENEILILGHTHYPMIREAVGGIVLNPGSVGQPRDRDPRASYAILDTENHDILLQRAYYDVADYQTKLSTMDWNSDMINILSRTK